MSHQQSGSRKELQEKLSTRCTTHPSRGSSMRTPIKAMGDCFYLSAAKGPSKLSPSARTPTEKDFEPQRQAPSSASTDSAKGG